MTTAANICTIVIYHPHSPRRVRWKPRDTDPRGDRNVPSVAIYRQRETEGEEIGSAFTLQPQRAL